MQRLLEDILPIAVRVVMCILAALAFVVPAIYTLEELSAAGHLSKWPVILTLIGIAAVYVVVASNVVHWGVEFWESRRPFF